jgi:hypothetical protein
VFVGLFVLGGLFLVLSGLFFALTIVYILEVLVFFFLRFLSFFYYWQMLIGFEKLFFWPMEIQG